MAEKIKVVVDIDLKDLIPGYLERLRGNVTTILDLLGKEDFEQIRVLGHNMKGSGGGYGFDRISELGYSIETGAKEGTIDAIRSSTEELGVYLENLDISYE